MTGIGALKRQTKNFLFNIINFNFARWHGYEHENWDLLDAILSVYVTSGGLKGIWKNSTSYAISDRVIDSEDSSLWLNLVSHTSAATPTTFAADRAANPTYWRSITYDPENRGVWAGPGTVYGVNDFVVSGNKYAIAIDDHVSGATFAGDAAHWMVLIDLSAVVPALEAADAALDVRLDTAEADINAIEIGKSDVGHTHVAANITDFATAVGAIKTPLPRSYLSGLGIANNAADATNDIDIAVGEARDSTNAKNIILTGALTKRLDAAWAVGNNQGGLDTGAIANGTYHVWLIMRSDTGVVDALFSTSATAPTMPANYDFKRRIGSILRVGGAIKSFIQRGDRFLWVASVEDYNTTTLGGVSTLVPLSVPLGIRTEAILQGLASNATLGTRASVYPPDVGNSSGGNGHTVRVNVAGSPSSLGRIEIDTDTSAQVRVISTQASTTLVLETYGYIDRRGRDD